MSQKWIKNQSFKEVSKNQLSQDLYSINIFKEINNYPPQVLDRFNDNFQFCSSKIIWKALSALWFKELMVHMFLI